MIRISIDCPDIDFARETLDRLAGIPIAAPAVEERPDKAATLPLAAATTARKQRADKGKPRGRLARTIARIKSAAALHTPAPVAAEKAQPPGQQEQHSAPAAEPVNIDPSAVTAAGKAVYDARGLEVARALLQRMGAQTMRDLKPEQWAEYIEKAKQTIDGSYDPVVG